MFFNGRETRNMSFLVQYKRQPRFRNHVLYLQLSARDLPPRDVGLMGGKSDPFLQFRKAHGIVQTDEGFASFDTPQPGVYMGEQKQRPAYDGKCSHIKNSLDPQWATVEISNLASLADDGDITLPVLIDVWDYDWDKTNDFMGFVVISIMELFEKYARGEPIPLQPGKPGHKWGGSLYVDHIELIAKGSKYSMLVDLVREEFRALSGNSDVAEPERVRRALIDRMGSLLRRLDVTLVPAGEAARTKVLKRLEDVTVSAAAFDINHDNKISWEEYWTVVRFGILHPLLNGEDLQLAAVAGDAVLTPGILSILEQLILGLRTV